MGNRIHSYRRLLAYVRPYRGTVLIAVIAAAIAAGATSLYAWLVGPLLKAVLTRSDLELPGMRVEGARLLWVLPAAVLLVALIKSSAQFLQNGLMNRTGQMVMADLRRDLYSKLLALPPKFFETRHSGELLSRFTADVAQVEFAVTQALASWVKDSLQILALLGACLAIDFRLFFLAFIVLPAAAIPVSRFAKSVKKVATKTQGSLGKLTELTSEQLQNLPVVQSYRGVPQAMEKFDEEQARYLQAISRSLFLRGAFTPTLEVLGLVGTAAAIAFGAKAVASEPELAGKLLSFLAAALLMYQPLKSLSGTFSLVVQGLGASERLFEIADEPMPKEEGSAAGALSDSLVFDGVSVSYDGERTALNGLNVTVRRGQKVALVGSSGAGKTTAFSVLLGFVSPSAGRLIWDGHDVSGLQRGTLRAQLGWVPQEPVLFSGTVRHNLLFGRPDATEAQLWDALRRAHADGFVKALPHGLDEWIGERGAGLSGGQRQRLAIARAFLREPSVLLLDEPTSALDSVSEREVQEGLRELMVGRTTLVIAHRLSTVQDADLICVIEAGTVVESGTHAELTAKNGRYAALLRHGELKAA